MTISCLDKTSMQKIEAVEKIFISYILHNSVAALISQDSSIDENFFITQKHKRLFTVLKTMEEKNIKINTLNVIASDPEIAQTYAMVEVEPFSGSTNMKVYIDSFKDFHRIMSIHSKVKTIDSVVSSWNFSEDTTNIIAALSSIEILEDKDDCCPYLNEGAIKEWENDFKEAYYSKENPYFSTGIEKLDAALNGGLYTGMMYTLAARPSIGKTALALNLAVAAAEKGTSVAYFSNEMFRNEIINRLNSMYSRVEYNKLKNCKSLTKEEMLRIKEANLKLSSLPIGLHIVKDASWFKVENRLRSDVKARNIKLAFVDYIQQYKASSFGNKKFNSDREEINFMTGRAKQLALQLDIAIVLVAQLNRELDKANGSRPPILSDLKDSGSIEQDSDVVLMLYVDNGGKQIDDILERDKREISGTIAKNRNGRPHQIDFLTDMRFNKFCKNEEEHDILTNNVETRFKGR